ncbi:MAG: hypothetical protein M1336_02345 [Deltaproteobacteria bacterium]|jgi:hypothetical protein|nr:hypothetical protein [Deltaproteobacteria bacterium]
MFKWLMRSRLATFDRTYDYDSSYAGDILAADTFAFLRFARLMGVSRYHKDVPLEAWYAAKLAATMAEDCGPCTQLNVTMAERHGVSPEVLKAIVARDERAISCDAALGFRFSEAVQRHDPAADGLREEILSRWGRRALVSLAFAVTAGRIFPTIKYALGHGRSCARVSVGGALAPVSPHHARGAISGRAS